MLLKNQIKLVDPMKPFQIFLLTILCCFSLHGKAQQDSLNYHSAIFRDTANMCNGSREKAWNYIVNHPAITNAGSTLILAYLGVDLVQTAGKQTIYSYCVDCTCHNGIVDWTSSYWRSIVTEGESVIKFTTLDGPCVR